MASLKRKKCKILEGPPRPFGRGLEKGGGGGGLGKEKYARSHHVLLGVG